MYLRDSSLKDNVLKYLYRLIKPGSCYEVAKPKQRWNACHNCFKQSAPVCLQSLDSIAVFADATHLWHLHVTLSLVFPKAATMYIHEIEYDVTAKKNYAGFSVVRIPLPCTTVCPQVIHVVIMFRSFVIQITLLVVILWPWCSREYHNIYEWGGFLEVLVPKNIAISALYKWENYFVFGWEQASLSLFVSL